ncbi:hypothetical protein [Aureimonas pseudogalii]|uniref:Uncharacterized protein n=1 Tax=Aureimonas pseudogalii TaxID=1744844 RepID=A0A7W6H7E0_9HYPH|nr:hypothetical protein [Aureimonas pseudogalii]MBB3999872.1 hypothetical protein [Aureimonas pseudogalii]
MFYIYLPFDDEELKHGADHYSQVAKVFLHGTKVDLSSIGSGDILYIFAHGRYGGGSQIVGTVKGFFGGNKTAYKTASEVASELAGYKLPKNFKDLRALVCWGGYVGGNTEWGKHTLRRVEGQAPFAGQLCSALKGKGYTNLNVTGYTGTVSFVGAKAPSYLSDILVTQGGAGAQAVKVGKLGDANSFAERDMPQTRARSGMSEQQGVNRSLSDSNRTVWY